MKIDRRNFIKKSALAGVGSAVAGKEAFSGTSEAPNILRGKDDRIVRLGFVGVGSMGRNLVRSCTAMAEVEINAISDIDEENLTRALDLVEESGRKRPEGYTEETSYEELVTRDDLDGVVIATPWLWHTPMTLAALRGGKHVAVEVRGAADIQECWDIVDTAEETGLQVMLLENHNYDRIEMSVLRMVREGLFGEPLHYQCGYCHSLVPGHKITRDGEFGEHTRGGAKWRGIHSLYRNGDLYPTHGLGPVANCINDNRGNRMVSLTSTATKARSINDYIVSELGPDHPNAHINWALGDVITTVVKCANGETITITHDTNSPRPYSNNCFVQGTRGVWMYHRQLCNHLHIRGRTSRGWEPWENYIPEFEHPLWKRFMEDGVRGDHGGAGFLKINAFVQALKRDLPVPIDVYDTATWLAVTPLTEKSISLGSQPVEFPDFTRGKWVTNKPIFGLDDQF